MQTVHFSISIRYNESDYMYSDPVVHNQFDFTIPEAMFSSQKFTSLVESVVADLKKAYPAAAKEYEAKRAAEKAQEA